MNILLILSSKIVSVDLRYLYGEIPSVLLPYNRKPVIFEQYNLYKNLYDKIYVLSKEKADLIKNYIKIINENNLEIIEVKNNSSIGNTILSSNLFNREYDNVSILFGDSLFDTKEIKNCIKKDSLIYSEVYDSLRWTLIKNKKIIDKEIVDYSPPFKAITGFFNFCNFFEFKHYLENNSFYNSLSKYWGKHDLELFKSETWIDLGHEDNFLKVKKNQSRIFNTLEIDYSKGIIKKTSLEKEKLLDEINWYNLIPNEIKYLTPRIFSYSLSKKNPFISMEYYSYDTLHELYLFGNLSKEKWNEVYSIIFKSLNELHKFKKRVSSKDIKNTFSQMYIEKINNRLNQLRKEEYFSSFFSKKIIINGNEYNSLEKIIDDLKEMYKLLNMTDVKFLDLIHGDFFFANIIYDNRNNIVRLIDPRGKFGDHNIFGDKRYDYAKLLHSVHGKYDLIVEDRFKLKKVKENNYIYNIDSNENQMNAEITLFEKLKSKKLNLKLLEFIEAGLFLSIPALHQEEKERQTVFLLRGIELFNKLKREIRK